MDFKIGYPLGVVVSNLVTSSSKDESCVLRGLGVGQVLKLIESNILVALFACQTWSWMYYVEWKFQVGSPSQILYYVNFCN